MLATSQYPLGSGHGVIEGGKLKIGFSHSPLHLNTAFLS